MVKFDKVLRDLKTFTGLETFVEEYDIHNKSSDTALKVVNKAYELGRRDALEAIRLYLKPILTKEKLAKIINAFKKHHQTEKLEALMELKDKLFYLYTTDYGSRSKDGLFRHTEETFFKTLEQISNNVHNDKYILVLLEPDIIRTILKTPLNQEHYNLKSILLRYVCIYGFYKLINEQNLLFPELYRYQVNFKDKYYINFEDLLEVMSDAKIFYNKTKC